MSAPQGEVASTYLPAGLPAPRPAADGVDAPFWEAARRGELVVQRCRSCGRFQWAPEWICHRCHSFDVGFDAVDPTGRVRSWERVWHAVHPALTDACPYLVVVVDLPHADGVRMIGNLLGDPLQPIEIDGPVEACFEHHDDFTLIHWQTPAHDGGPR